jgi:glycosyltransferase involved in cell wall biosynthesis
MKILWAKAGGILPLDSGGRIRSFHIASELTRRHDVSLFAFYSSLAPDPHDGFCEPFAQLHCLPLDVSERGGMREMLTYALNALTLKPYQMRKYCRPAVAQRLRELLREVHYDVLLCDFLLTAGVVPWDISIPTVMFTHNVEAVIWRRHFDVQQNLFWKLMAWREYRTWARVENHYTRLADHVLTVSDNDREAFLEFLPPHKVTTVPTGVDLNYFQPGQGTPEAASLVFTGDMGWLPNEDAIAYFAGEILPIIQRSIPDVTLWAVGRSPTRKVLSIAKKNPAVRVTGAVDDIRPHVHRAAAYVVPLRIGGGTRIKIFEAMAMGMPVVSTTVGAEGLPVRDGEHILLADSPNEFACQTIRLLAEAPLRDRMGRAARALVESRYSWSAVTEVLDRVIDSVVRSKTSNVSTRSMT